MLAIIGGTGLNSLADFEADAPREVETDYSEAPVTVTMGSLAGQPLCFLPRHGKGHTVPPHGINYRANIQALARVGVSQVVAVNAVGGIHKAMGPGVIAVPDQIIDYSWGREHTFFTGAPAGLDHIDFTFPYDQTLRQRLIDAAAACGVSLWPQGVYACTQGPRLETAAEVRRLQRDGCDMVGMTGMPEAALAREAGLSYACLALSVNWGAGLTDGIITMEAIEQVIGTGMQSVQRLLLETIRALPA